MAEKARWYLACVKRVLLTGMSGTGKSTIVQELAARGYKAIDTDSDEWSEWVTIPVDHSDTASSSAGEELVEPAEEWQGRDWVWREDRIQRLLSTEDADMLFVSGCKSNQGKFYPQFDHVVRPHPPA